MNKTLFVISALAVVGAAHADNLVLWTFDTFTANSSSSSVGTIDPSPTEMASGVASAQFTTTFEGGVNTNASGAPTGSVGSFGGTTTGDPRVSPAATGALVGTGGLTSPNVTNNGASFTWQVSAASGQALNLSSFAFATRGTGTGFNNNQLAWSTNGTTWTNVGSTWGATTSTWNIISTDLSGVSALQGASNAYLRITFDGASSTAGNNRLDNILLSGTTSPVPEPATMAVLGLGVLAALRRRKSAK